MVWTNVHGHHEGHIELDWLREKCYSKESLRQNNDRVTPLMTVSAIMLSKDYLTVYIVGVFQQGNHPMIKCQLFKIYI